MNKSTSPYKISYIRENTMPSASEAQQNDVEGGEDYPDGIFVYVFFHFLVTKYQVPLRPEKKLKIYYVWILHMKKLRQHSGKFMT